MVHTIALGSGQNDRQVDPDHGWREHLTMAAAAVATMAVMLGSAIISSDGGLRTRISPPDLPAPLVTARALYALETLPHAYQAGDSVIVPTAEDANLDWVGALSSDRIVGHPVPTYAHGLASYADFPTSTEAPGWIGELRHGDRVFADVGPLWLACTTWPGQDDCSASLLMRNQGDFYMYRSGVGPAHFLDDEAPMEILTFSSIEWGQPRRLLVGGLGGTDTEDVSLVLEDGSLVPARVSVDEVIAGETMWWTTVSLPVESVTAYDSFGDVVSRVQFADNG